MLYSLTMYKKNEWFFNPQTYKSADSLFKAVTDNMTVNFEKDKTPHDFINVSIDEEIVMQKLRYALPGYKKNEVEIKLENQALTIKVSKKQKLKTEDSKETYVCRKIPFSAIEHSIFLDPSLFDYKQISSSLKDGVLEICLPFSEKQIDSKKKISVNID